MTTTTQLKMALKNGKGKVTLTEADLEAATQLLASRESVPMGRGRMSYRPYDVRRMARGTTPASDLGYPAWTSISDLAPATPQAGDIIVEQSAVCA